MSLVGTRPILQEELRQYELHHRARIAIKPGITGMWQVSGRSDITDFEEVVRLDTEYISKSSAAGRSSSCWTTHRVWTACPSPMCSSSCWKITAPSWCAPPAPSRSSRPISLSVQKIRKLPKRLKQRFARVLKSS